MPWINLLVIPLAFVLTVLLGHYLIKYLERTQVRQTVRDDGPQSHFIKSGTPTMGGLMFLLPTLLIGIAASIYARSWIVMVVLIITLTMAVIGFLDDYIKVRINKEGLTPAQKTRPMLIACVVFAIYYLYLNPAAPEIIWPFAWGVTPIVGIWKAIYGVFIVIFMYFTINAVNITDGVDGLLSTLSIPVFSSLIIAVIHHARGNASGQAASLVYLALIGGLLGFLVYNHHPAKIFMGDTGSLAIGALFASSVIFLGAPWLLLGSGIIYLVEAMSVVIQVLYFKATHGKRIFRMSPIHHHFELGGWSENKIVAVFSAIALLGSLLALLGLAVWT